jgi:hypothetical protein
MQSSAQMRTDIAQLYVALFLRAPDGEGLLYWLSVLGSGKTTAEIADAMFATSPARLYYPSSITSQEVIGAFYTQVLGRTADAEGLAFWTARLQADGATPGSVITEMISVVAAYAGTDAAGLQSAMLFDKRVTVAQYYAEEGGDVAHAAQAIGWLQWDSDIYSQWPMAPYPVPSVESETRLVRPQGSPPDSLRLTLGSWVAGHSIDIADSSTAIAITNLDPLNSIVLANSGGALDTVNISGTQGLTLEGLPRQVTVLQGGSGNDTIELNSDLAESIWLNGGAGVDTLAFDGLDSFNANASRATVHDFEYVELAPTEFGTTYFGAAYDMAQLNAGPELRGIVGVATEARRVLQVRNMTSDTARDITLESGIISVDMSSRDFVDGGADAARVTLKGCAIEGFEFLQADVLTIVSATGPASPETPNHLTLRGVDLDQVFVAGDQVLFLTLLTWQDAVLVDASALRASLRLEINEQQFADVRDSTSDDVIDLDCRFAAVSLSGGKDKVIFSEPNRADFAYGVTFESTALGLGALAAGTATSIEFQAPYATIGLAFSATVLGMLKVNGTFLSLAVDDVDLAAATLGSNTNVAAVVQDGHLNLQVDADGNGVFEATKDVRIELVGSHAGGELRFDAATGLIAFTDG